MQVMNLLIEQVSGYQKGEGGSLNLLTNMKYKPLRGSSYLPLPEQNKEQKSND